MPEYYEDMLETIYNSDDESTVSRKEVNDKEKYVHKIIRQVYSPEKQRMVKRTIKCFSSGDTGNTIRNAQFGTKYMYVYSQKSSNYVLITDDLDLFRYRKEKKIIHKVGSRDEDIYFKVMICTGENKRVNEPITLFYNNPSQYERHFDIELPRETKKRWNEKRKERLANYEHRFLYKEELPDVQMTEHEGVNVVIH
jgi:hypothetical protein